MVNQCPICKHRVQDWQMSAGKAKEVGDYVVHTSCLIEYQQRTGAEFKGESHEA